jgi:acyl-CoA reductase-like NAD-dependent aldehyde dehydrogenase
VGVSVDGKRIFIGEEFAEGANGGWREAMNPATGEVIAEVPECSEGDVDRAVTAPQRAFESGSIHAGRTVPDAAQAHRRPGRERGGACEDRVAQRG